MTLACPPIFGGKGEKDYSNKRSTFPQLKQFIHSFNRVIHRKQAFEPGVDHSPLENPTLRSRSLLYLSDLLLTLGGQMKPNEFRVDGH